MHPSESPKPLKPYHVRPARVAISIMVLFVGFFAVLFVGLEGARQYQLWRAGGIWCATFDADGSYFIQYGAEACGYNQELVGEPAEAI